MTDFSESCVFCNATEDLNTIMTILVDDKSYKIAVGDSCEDKALPKKIKEALKTKLEAVEKEQKDKDAKLEALKQAAADLGFELAPTGSSQLIIPTMLQSGSVATSPPKDLSNSPTIEQDGGKFVVQRNTREAKPKRPPAQPETVSEVAQISASGFPGAEIGGPAEYQSHVIPESIQPRREPIQARREPANQKPETITKTNQTVPGRLGIPTVIPSKIVGTDGSTEITVVKTGGDNLLQRRMRALNQARNQAEDAGIGASSQPHDRIRNCASCNGGGEVKGRICIRCRGAGFIGIM